MESKEFDGCKVALFRNDHLLVYLRDDNPNIKAPNMWDLPGGGREGKETPEECVLRELEEEFGLVMSPDRLIYRKRYYREHLKSTAYFFGGIIHQSEIDDISFGSEGQYWTMMHIDEYLANPKVVERHKQRMRDYLERGDT